MVSELTLSSTPPPWEYSMVNVVFAGANPNVFVFKKLLGSNAVVK